MSIYSNDNISKIAKLTTRELPHLAKIAKITVRENNGVYSISFLLSSLMLLLNWCSKNNFQIRYVHMHVHIFCKLYKFTLCIYIVLLVSVNIELAARSDTTLALAWGTPDGTYDGLRLQVSEGGGTSITEELTVSDTSFNVTDLIPGTVYTASLYTVSGSTEQLVTAEEFQTCEFT